MHGWIRVAVLAASLVGGAGCDSGSQPRPFASPSPVPALPAPRAELAGAYTLTIEADASCADLPAAARTRSYRVTLDVTPYPYFAISAEGGGFTQPVVMGSVWGNGSFSWNSDEMGECVGRSEPMSQSSSVLICGTGVAQESETTISALVFGTVIATWMEPDPLGDAEWRQTTVCEGRHQFTFRRASN